MNSSVGVAQNQSILFRSWYLYCLSFKTINISILNVNPVNQKETFRDQ